MQMIIYNLILITLIIFNNKQIKINKCKMVMEINKMVKMDIKIMLKNKIKNNNNSNIYSLIKIQMII